MAFLVRGHSRIVAFTAAKNIDVMVQISAGALSTQWLPTTLWMSLLEATALV